ncbi:MAG TPA: hypothetical protein VFT70_18690 [Nocardioides sp.]|nr:hypothetical protein [Nocardioides sp.]
MRVRWIGLTLALVLLGAVTGYGVGVLRQEQPTTFAAAAPVPASSPSVPVVPAPTYAPDIDYPALRTDLSYKPHQLGEPTYRWRYDVPRGWTPEDVSPLFEVRWRPPDEPTIGGYSLRVKLVNEHRTTAEMVAAKLRAVRSIYEDVKVLARTDDMLSFRYRDPGQNTQRFNTFTWFTAPGGTLAEFEMSVVGREADLPGLDSLRDEVAASVEKLS